MQSAWVAFARNPSLGLRGPGFSWPLYNSDVMAINPTLADLGGYHNVSGDHFAFPVLFDANCTSDVTTFQLLAEVLTAFGVPLI
jgi:hypothetical protein